MSAPEATSNGSVPRASDVAQSETEMAVVPQEPRSVRLVDEPEHVQSNGNGISLQLPLEPTTEETDAETQLQKSGGGKAMTALPAGYLAYLNTLRAAWGDLPDLTVTYSQLAYQVTVPKVKVEVPNLWSAFIDGVKGLNPLRDNNTVTEQFRPLHASSGVVRPGELTLILAPPGHGKSVLLKTLAGRMVREGDAVRGEVRWNGLTAAESAQAGQQINKLTAYVEQGDVHFPMLTVRETFQFALSQSNADVTLLTGEDAVKLKELQDRKVELMLELLGLRECADTPVGNAMMRGVSGGQKKRVTLGEMMIGQARALFLDEISTGLDSSATFDIVSALQRWCRVMNGSAVVALLQPAPEVLAMFDNLILMRHGQIVFSGTQAQLHAHLARLRIEPDEDIDFADWIVDFLTDPPAIWKRDMEKRIERRGRSSARKSFREQHGSFREVPGPEPLPASVKHLASVNGAAPNASFRDEASLPNQAQTIVQPPGPNDGKHVEVALAPVPVAAAPASFEQDAEAPAVVFHIGADEDASADRDNLPVPPAQRNGAVAPANGLSNGNGRQKTLGRVFRADEMPPLSTPELRHAYESSTLHQDLLAEISTRNAALTQQHATQAASRSAFTQRQLFSALAGSLWHHTRVCLWRQWAFMSRSPEFVVPRLMQSIVMGLVMGSLFWQLGTGPNDFSPRIGLILFVLIFAAFANMSEVPLASEFKLVVYKQVDAGMYSTFSYVFAVVLMHFPLAVGECALLGTIIYWMVDYANDAGRFFFFLLLLLCVNLAMSGVFRTVAYTARNPDIALNLAGPLTAICLLFGGFLITADLIPDWLIWVYYLSPFSWGLRSGALNEFHSERYNSVLPDGGNTYLRVWQIDTNDQYKWSGIGYLLGLFIVAICASAAALAYKRSWLTVGTRREHTEEGHAHDDTGSTASAATLDAIQRQRQLPGGGDVRIGMKTSSMIRAADAQQALEDTHELHFQRMDISFADLTYTVQMPDEEHKGKTKDRKLLQGVSGYAKAGELTALMGSSGAGKTTLMDVIAGRKTSGKIEGDIRINGQPQVFPAFNRLMGYVEQTDIHVGMHTVREAIEFSARLRLPSTVSAESRAHFVDLILDDLELQPLAGRIIGDENVEGLSPGELKRLTIGVELAANPTFLFLDEPTSGLDSRAALVVLRVLRKISRRGRSVVCTIHQPSAELFGHFDRLLLLKSGGKVVYLGDLGEDGLSVAEYFTSAPLEPEFEQPTLPEKVNIASWMLDVIGAGTTSGRKIPAYEEVYMKSELRKQNEAELARVAQPHDYNNGDAKAVAAEFDSVYAASYFVQFNEVLKRLFLIYWRDTSYNGTKFFLMAFLGVLFGLVYLQIDDDDEPGMISKLSVIYMTTGFTGVLHASNALPVIFRLREAFYRERASNTFAPWVYASTLAIVELPYVLMCTILFVLPLYFLVGFEYTAASFFQYLFIMFLEALLFSYFGQMMASLLPNIQVANILCGLCFTFFFLFGGVFIQRGVMPKGWVWMYEIDFIPKGFIPLAVQQFKDKDTADDLLDTVQYGQVTKWNYVQNYLSTSQEWQWNMVGWVIFEIVCVRILIAFIVQKVSHQKR